MTTKADAELARLAQRFPDWDCWFGIDCLWHARLRGALPPVMCAVRMPRTWTTRS